MAERKHIRLFKNIGIVFVGNFGSRLLLFLMVPFYTGVLDRTQYGVADMISTYAIMLIGVVSCQIQDSVFIFPKDQPFIAQKRFFSGGLVFLLLSYLCWAAVFGLLGFVPLSKFFVSHRQLIFAFIVLNSMQCFMQSFCRGIDRMPVYAATGLLQTVVTIAASVIWLPKSPNGETMIRIQLAGMCCAVIYAGIAIRFWRYLYVSSGSKRALIAMLKFSIPLIPSSFMWWAISSLNRPFLEKYTSMAVIGLYAVALKIPSILQILWDVTGNAWQISVLEEYSKEDFEHYYNAFFEVVIAVALMICTGLAALAPLYMRIIVGAEFYEGFKLIPAMLFGAVFSIAGGVVGAVFAAEKKSRYYLYTALCTLAAVVAFNALLIPRWGLNGAIAANMLSMAVAFVVRWFFSRKFVAFHWNWNKIKYFVLYLLTVLTFYFLSDIRGKVASYVVIILLFAGLLFGDWRRLIKFRAAR